MLVVLLVSTSGVFAGISSPYWGGSNPNPLKLHAGETKDVFFNLQNCPSMAANCAKKDDVLMAALMEGSEIAQITSGEKYTVPYGTADSYITVKVTIPEDANVGDSYTVKFSVNTVSEEGTGTVQLGVGYYVDFPVQVIGGAVEPEPTPAETGGDESGKNKIFFWTLGGVFVIVIIIIIVLIIWLSNKKREI